MKAIKVRIYPNNEQIQLIEKSFGCCRFIYNYGLERKTKHYNETKKSLSIFDIEKELPKLKKNEETQWLKEVPSQILQQSLGDLESAFSAFFKKRAKFPKFKSKKRPKQSFRFPQGFDVLFEQKVLKLPKIGYIKFKDKFKFNKKMDFRQITISKYAKNYYASILIDDGSKSPEKQKIKENKTLGIDLGIRNYATFSTGEKIENPKFEQKYRNKLALEQQKLEKKQKDSKNYEKQKQKITKIYEKIKNCRTDFLHKLTTGLVKNQDWTSYAIEDLSVKEMQKDNYTACNRAIGDVGWYNFRRMLEYKSECVGKNVLVIGRFEASSKTCSCGVKNENLILEDRNWVCLNCGAFHDRDILAANNIKLFALSNNLLAGHANRE